MVAVRKRIRVNGVLYEEVRRGTRRLDEATARPFNRNDYRSFNVGDLPDGARPRIYWKDVDWEVGSDAAALAIGGDAGDGLETVIALQWIDDDNHAASLFFADQDEAERVFSKMLKDVDRLKPRALARKYRMDVDY